jgi:uncharacterized SAM-binding protein YcdF (DUF218 family)
MFEHRELRPQLIGDTIGILIAMMDDNVRFTRCHKPWLFTIYFWLGMICGIGLTISGRSLARLYRDTPPVIKRGVLENPICI